MATSPDDLEPIDDLQSEYDFRSLRGVVRGKYAARYRERLRVVRAIEALEHTAGAEARQLLAELAAGAPEAHQTRQARAALQRRERRSAGPGKAP